MGGIGVAILGVALIVLVLRMLLAQAVTENRLAPRGEDVWIGLEPADVDAEWLARDVLAAVESASGEPVDGGRPGAAAAPAATAPAATGAAARSFHAGGVNAAMGDGSVRFVTNSVALPTWQALATRAAGDVPGAGF